MAKTRNPADTAAYVDELRDRLQGEDNPHRRAMIEEMIQEAIGVSGIVPRPTGVPQYVRVQGGVDPGEPIVVSNGHAQLSMVVAATLDVEGGGRAWLCELDDLKIIAYHDGFGWVANVPEDDDGQEEKGGDQSPEGPEGSKPGERAR